MIERYLTAVCWDDPGREDPVATRARLRERFPRGATRRMTQLGLLIGGVLHDLVPGEEDTLVYASSYAENQALEEYLASFPNPSPTLFQTSIHPSAVQQVLIARQQAVREFFPFTGRRQLVAHSLLAALLGTGTRAVLCGGEERGRWLRDHGMGSDESFAFAVALHRDNAGAVGRLRLEPTGAAEGSLTLREFFDCLRERRALHLAAAPGINLELTWS
jgi:hypothetical protein